MSKDPIIPFHRNKKLISDLSTKVENLSSQASVLQSKNKELELKLDKDSKKVIVNHIHVKPIARKGADIKKWRTALKSAEGRSQNRLTLYTLYAESLLDGHLTAIIEKRIEAITNTNINFTAADGTVDDGITSITSQPYFQKMLKEIVNTKFWGHTLLQLDFPMPNQELSDGQVILVPRAYVKPRFGIVVQNSNDLVGIDYTDNEWHDITMSVGDNEDLGLLLPAVKYEIIKRGALSDWAEFCETFGVDPLIAKYNNDQTRMEINKALDERGAGGSMTVPNGVEIEPLAGISKTGSSQLFSKLNESMNDGMSVVILGQTMTTTDSKSAGYAQGKIHSQVEGSKYRSDRRFVERILNNQLTPYLERIGWKVKDGKWNFVDEDHLSLTERIKVDKELASIIPLNEDELYKTYGRTKPKENKTTGKEEDNKEKKNRGFF